MKCTALLFLAAAVVASGVYACSDDDTAATPAPGADGGPDSGTSGTDGAVTDANQTSDSNIADGGVDANVPAPCSESDLDLPSNDFRGTDAGGQGIGGADVSFPFNDSPAQYVNRCVKIKVGQQITFAGSFSSHPLAAYGGDTPSPIPALTNADQDGGALVVVFNAAGTFGYRCDIHRTLMTGAVKVVP